jgi:hypothetical protein
MSRQSTVGTIEWRVVQVGGPKRWARLAYPGSSKYRYRAFCGDLGELPLTLVLQLNATVSILAFLARASLLMAVAAVIDQSKWLWFKATRRLVGPQSFEDASRGLGFSQYALKVGCDVVVKDDGSALGKPRDGLVVGRNRSL